jgi:hypothetical protein
MFIHSSLHKRDGNDESSGEVHFASSAISECAGKWSHMISV